MKINQQESVQCELVFGIRLSGVEETDFPCMAFKPVSSCPSFVTGYHFPDA